MVSTNDFTNKWMERLPGTKRISEFTIPGTHESCALHGGFATFAKCQTKSLKEQLEGGIRFLDIRCRHYKNAFPIHHEQVYQEINFEDVQDICIDFLNFHPSECIIMSIKEEYKAEDNTLTFEEIFNFYTAVNPNYWYLGDRIPTLDEARGKIVLFRRFNTNRQKGIDATNWRDQETFIIDTSDLKIKIQDKYSVPTIFDREQKWEYVKDLINETEFNSVDWYINFASGSSPGAYPDAVADVVNPKLAEYIRSKQFKNRIGTILMDYVADDGIVERLISLNSFEEPASPNDESGEEEDETTDEQEDEDEEETTDEQEGEEEDETTDEQEDEDEDETTDEQEDEDEDEDETTDEQEDEEETTDEQEDEDEEETIDEQEDEDEEEK